MPLMICSLGAELTEEHQRVEGKTSEGAGTEGIRLFFMCGR